VSLPDFDHGPARKRRQAVKHFDAAFLLPLPFCDGQEQDPVLSSGSRCGGVGGCGVGGSGGGDGLSYTKKGRIKNMQQGIFECSSALSDLSDDDFTYDVQQHVTNFECSNALSGCCSDQIDLLEHCSAGSDEFELED